MADLYLKAMYSRKTKHKSNWTSYKVEAAYGKMQND